MAVGQRLGGINSARTLATPPAHPAPMRVATAQPVFSSAPGYMRDAPASQLEPLGKPENAHSDGWCKPQTDPAQSS